MVTTTYNGRQLGFGHVLDEHRLDGGLHGDVFVLATHHQYVLAVDDLDVAPRVVFERAAFHHHFLADGIHARQGEQLRFEHERRFVGVHFHVRVHLFSPFHLNCTRQQKRSVRFGSLTKLNVRPIDLLTFERRHILSYVCEEGATEDCDDSRSCFHMKHPTGADVTTETGERAGELGTVLKAESRVRDSKCARHVRSAVKTENIVISR